MDQTGLFDLLMSMLNSNDLSFQLKKQIISDVLTDQDALDLLGLRFTELIDPMQQMAVDDSDKTDLMEMKLLALQTLDFPDKYLADKNIDLHELLLEYLDMVKSKYISVKGIEVLEGFLNDKHYVNDIDEYLLEFVNNEDKIMLMFRINKQRLKNLGVGKNSAFVNSADYYQRINERYHILLKIFLVTHPKISSEIFYMLFPVTYSYESVCADWYWVKKDSYDYYAENKIISVKESDVLYKIGSVIDNDDFKNRDTEYNKMMLDLFDEFVDNREFTDVLFPDFLKSY
ncbi:MAG: hypothetical protein J1E40_01110 [Oscillospiraceae bacterium]|nr:hypothetical protein [Oscillospiraceae bacterium]